MYTHHPFGKDPMNEWIIIHLLLMKQIKSPFVARLAVADQRGDYKHLGETDHPNADHTMHLCEFNLASGIYTCVQCCGVC
jgi:hypothetical protein